MNLLKVSEAASIAFHGMAVLAAAEGGGRLSNPQLAERLDVSGHHLAKVFQRLNRGGLVRSVRGPGGGFDLARPAEEISLLEIFEVVEGPLGEAGCLLSRPVCDGECCILGGLIQKVQIEARDYLSNTSLAQLARHIPVEARQ